MERLKSLSALRKGLLVALALMMVIFGALYLVVGRRLGYCYDNAIFVPTTQGSVTTYSGSLKGKAAAFRVDRTEGWLTFAWGGKTYGPYEIQETPEAVPQAYAENEAATGLELWEGDTLLFRGCVIPTTEGVLCVQEDGQWQDALVITYSANGIEYDADGNVIDPMEPMVYTILELYYHPELTHKGQWRIFLMAVVMSAGLAVSILSAEDIFYLKMSFCVSEPEKVQPSDWTLAMWNIGWTVCFGGILVFYIIGLL